MSSELPMFHRRASGREKVRAAQWYYSDRGVYKEGRDSQLQRLTFSNEAIEWILQGDSTLQDLQKVRLADKGETIYEWAELLKRGQFPTHDLEDNRVDFQQDMGNVQNSVIAYLKKIGTFRVLERLYQTKKAGKKGAEARYGRSANEELPQGNEDL
jgi:hypothetical protein